MLLSRLRARPGLGTRRGGEPGRKDAMLEAVEGDSGDDSLRGVVKAYIDAGVDIEALFEDLDQIRALVDEADSDLVLDVMDLDVGHCYPSSRLGLYAYDDPRNPFRRRDQERAQRPTEGRDVEHRPEGELELHSVDAVRRPSATR